MSTHNYIADAEAASGDGIEAPVSVSRIVHTIDAYKATIALALATVALAYLIIAIILYLLAPVQKTTEQPFRLEFEGSDEGRYPNGVKFSSSEIVTTPVLLKVFNDNGLKRFIEFNEFNKSIVVLGSNLAYERLAADYRGRISDPRLTPGDRERLQKDWDARLQAAMRNDFSLVYIRDKRSADIPEKVVRKVLVDVLTEWAKLSTQTRHVLSYRMSVLSPDVVSSKWTSDAFVRVHVLRDKLRSVRDNVSDLREIPGADQIRTNRDNVSLAEIDLKVDEMLRFRLEPLAMAAAHATADRTAALRFASAQLSHDTTQLQGLRDRAEVIRQSLLVYANQRGDTQQGTGITSSTPPATSGSSETVMPQFNDSFIERIMALARDPEDVKYRQKLVDEYRKAAELVIPASEAVAFDKQIIAQLEASRGGGTVEGLQKEIDATAGEARALIENMNAIYKTLSANLNPSTELFSLTAPPVTVTEHGVSIPRLALYGLLALLLSLPVIIVACLLHNRVRQEDAAERLHPHTA